MRTRFILAAPLLLAGCATSGLKMAPPSPDRPWTPAVDAAGAIKPGAPSSRPSQAGYVLPSNPEAGAMPLEPVAPEIDPSRIYDLADLIDLAETTNPETRIAWNEARNAALMAGVARATYLPRLTATAIGGYQTNSGRSTLQGVSSDQNRSLTGTVSSLSLQWLLFDFGKRGAIVEAADQGSVIANIGFTAAHQKLIHTVSLAFYAYSAARARAASADASLKDAREVQDAAESRRAHGIGTLIEVAQARQFTAQAELAKVQADGASVDNYVTLLSVMGIPPLAKIRIADASRRPIQGALDKPVDKILAESLARRTDILAAISAEKAANAGIRAAKADFLPKVFVSASGSYTTGSIDVTAVPSAGEQAPTVNVSSHRWGATILGGVTIPLYDGGVRDAALAQARNRADSASQAVTRTKTAAGQEIVLANSKLRTSLASIDATNSLLQASQTTYDAALAAFRNGVGASTEMLVAERQLLEARNLQVEAHSAALAAAATLALACGSLGSAP